MLQITDTKNFIHEVGFHSDIQNLIWYEDCDTLIQDESTKPHFISGENFYLNPYLEEVSTIYSNMVVQFPKENEFVKPIHLNYGTKTCSYAEMTPLQRGGYIQFLQNPYSEPKDIGYLYLLYEGLERFLLTDRWESAFSVVKKLRNIHKTEVFQNYSLDALLVSALIHKDEKKITEILTYEQTDKIQKDLYYYCSYIFHFPIQINGQKVYIENVFDKKTIESLPLRNIVFFQNLSLRLTEIKIKMITELL